MASITRFSLDKISNYIDSQVPGFIRDNDNQNFIGFVKAYYQFLEDKLVSVVITSNTTIETIGSGESVSAINGLLCGDGITFLGSGSNTEPILEIDSYIKDYKIVTPERFYGVSFGSYDINNEDDILLKKIIIEHKTGSVNNFDVIEDTTVISDSIIADSNYYLLDLTDITGTFVVGNTVKAFDGQLDIDVSSTVLDYDSTNKVLKVSMPSNGFYHVGNQIKDTSNASIQAIVTSISTKNFPILYSTQELETPVYALTNLFNYGDVDYAFNSQLFKDSDYYYHLSEEILKNWQHEFYLTIENKIKGLVAANITDVYQSKGTPNSINAVTKILWGTEVTIKNPSEKIYALNNGEWTKNGLQLVTAIDPNGDILSSVGRVVYKKGDMVNYGYVESVAEEYTTESDPNYAFVGPVDPLSIYEIGTAPNSTYTTSACKVANNRIAICWSGGVDPISNFVIGTVKDTIIHLDEESRYSFDLEGTYNAMCYDSIDNKVVVAFDNKIAVGYEEGSLFTFNAYEDVLPDTNHHSKRLLFIPEKNKFVLLYSNHATLKTYIKAGVYLNDSFQWGEPVEVLNAVSTNTTSFYSLLYDEIQDVVISVYHGSSGSEHKIWAQTFTVNTDNSIDSIDPVILEDLDVFPAGLSVTYDSTNNRIVYAVGYGQNLITNYVLIDPTDNKAISKSGLGVSLTDLSEGSFYGIGCAYDSTINRIIYTWGLSDISLTYVDHYTKIGNIQNDILTLATDATLLNISSGSDEDFLVSDVFNGKAVYISKNVLGGGEYVIIKADRTGNAIVNLPSVIGDIFAEDTITGTSSIDEIFDCYVYETIDSSEYYDDNNLLNGGKLRELPISYAEWDDTSALAAANTSVTSRIQDSYYYQPYSYDILGDNFYTQDMFQTVSAAAGYDHNLAVKADGNLLAWGQNDYGQLGIGTNLSKTVPTEVGFDANYPWIKVSAGKWASYGIKSSGKADSGTLWSWGNNWYGQLGYDTTEDVYGQIATNCSSLVQVGSMVDWCSADDSRIDGYTAVKPDGTLWAWGYNEYGQVGSGTTFNYSSPVQISTGGGYWRRSYGGALHTAAVRSDNTLWTWGRNDFGQLGHGDTIDTIVPNQVEGIDWYSASVGYMHTVAIKTDGTLWAWGSNEYGQLGDGTTDSKSSPVQIGTDSNWAQIDTQYYHTLAIKTDGTLWAWGKNSWGAIGNGTQNNYSSPIQVGLESDWIQVSAGVDHSEGIRYDGSLWSWGLNKYGQLGLGELPELQEDNLSIVQTPTQIGLLTDWDDSTSLGYNSKFYVTVKTDGTLWGWGSNIYGQLGDGTTNNYSSPIQIGTANTWIQVAEGTHHTVAIDSSGKLWSWGRNNYGQLGDGTTVDSSSPSQIGSSTNWKQVVCGTYSTIAIKTNGTLWAWGRNERGELGNGTTNNSSTPAQIGAATTWKQIAFSSQHVVAVKNNGTLWAWGSNTHGQLGNGTRIGTSTPAQIGSSNDWSQVVAGIYHTVAIKSDGTLWGWGYNQYGQLGNDTTLRCSSPVQIGSASDWSQVTTNYYHTSAVKLDGSLWSWGWNNYGQLGMGTLTSNVEPNQVGTSNNWIHVENSATSTYAVTANNEIYSWGQNDFGQLGYVDSYTYNKNVSFPTLVSSSNTWIEVSSAHLYTAGIKSDGTLWTWGYNRYGQLGHGDIVDCSSPVQVGSLTNWNRVTCLQNSLLVTNTDGELYGVGYNETGNLGVANGLGYYQDITNRLSPVQIGVDFDWKGVSANPNGTFALGLKTDGTLWAWGKNDYGQLGHGDSINYSSPVQVGTDKVWSKISAGADFAAAVTDDGTLWAWGNNSFGQVGNGINGIYSSPVQVGINKEWKDISCGLNSTLGLKANSTLWAWGRNNYGQLGNNTVVDKSFPVQISSKTWNSVSAGENYCFAINKDNILYGWGQGGYELGIDTSSIISSPTQISTGTWDSVIAGRKTSLGISDSVLYTWGENYLGSETITVSYDPIKIISIPIDAIFVDDYKATIQNLVHPAGMKMFINGE